MPSTFVIVGASLAGGTAAASLRDRGFDGRIVLVGREPEPPYERPPLSKEYLRGETPFSKALVRPPDHYASAGIEARFGVEATRIEPRERVVHLSDGEVLGYDKLLVTTGGRNRKLRVPGAGLDGIHDLRTVGDADHIREEIVPGRRAVVVGMGFIGAEVAASLRRSGVEVAAVEIFTVPLYRALGEEVGRVLEGIHRDQGVSLFLGDSVAAFEGDGRVERVVTEGGRRIECDFVVIGVGIEPVTDPVADTDVRLDNGIVVDELCRTSVEGIFAAGDVANHYHPVFGRHVRVEHWQNAMKQGEAAAKSMLGSGEPYDEVHWFWSDQYDDNIQYAGFHTEWDELVIRGSLDERRFVGFYRQQERVLAAVAVNAGRDLRRAMPLVKSGAVVEAAALADPTTDLKALAKAG